MDNGKTIRETRDIDWPLVIRHFYHHSGWAQLLESEFPEHMAIGPIGQIIPWNFPLLMLSWKVAPALASGNTVVIKPSEYTPLSIMHWLQVACDHLPAGIINMITGDGVTGSYLVEHPDTRVIAFTGSVDTGKKIALMAAKQLKKTSLE